MLTNMVSVKSCLLELVDKLSEATDKKLISIEVFIDLAKAFDTVNHKILLGKLEHYGIRGVTLSWFRSFFTNRKQYVVIDKYKSDCAQITCGVPQGSILGPLLFLVYINNLNYASKILKPIMFADDTNTSVSMVSRLHSSRRCLYWNQLFRPSPVFARRREVISVCREQKQKRLGHEASPLLGPPSGTVCLTIWGTLPWVYLFSNKDWNRICLNNVDVWYSLNWHLPPHSS